MCSARGRGGCAERGALDAFVSCAWRPCRGQAWLGGLRVKMGRGGRVSDNMCFAACSLARSAFRTHSTFTHRLNLAFHSQRASSHMALCQSVRLADQLAEKFLAPGCVTAGTHGNTWDNAAQREVLYLLWPAGAHGSGVRTRAIPSVWAGN